MPGCQGAYTATASEAAYRPACSRGSFGWKVLGRLSGRYREQARSHRYSVHLQDFGRLAGRLREQARSHNWTVCSSKIRSAVRPPSLASQLLQKSKGRSPYTDAPHHSSGRALARLQLLILIHPPPRKAEWRCSSGDWRAAPFDAVELIACRSKRSRPEGNAPG